MVETTLYLYVCPELACFDQTLQQWDEIGSRPFLDSIDIDNRIEAILSGIFHAWFEFQDQDVGSGWIKTVDLQLYCRYLTGAGTPQIAGTVLHDVTEKSCGTISPDATWAWKDFSLALDALGIDTWEEINALKMKLKNDPILGGEVQNLNVDAFNEQTGWQGWEREGADPWIDAQDEPTNQIKSNSDADKIGDFTFQNISGGSWAGSAVELKLYCVGNGSSEIYVEVWEEGVGWSTPYTVIPNATFSTKIIDVTSILTSEAKINAAKVRYTHERIGSPAYTIIDHAYLKVYIYPTAKKVQIACARIKVIYDPEYQMIQKSPTENEVESGGWTNPDNAHADGGGYTDTGIIGAKQRYKTYNFNPATMDELAEVKVLTDAWRSVIGAPDAIKIGISKNGGVDWHDHEHGLGTTEQTIEDNFSDIILVPNDLHNDNLRTRIWAGSSACLTDNCEISLWFTQKNERMRLKNDVPVYKMDLLYELWLKYKKGHVKILDVPKLIGWDWETGFGEATIKDIIKHENVPCYHIRVQEIVPTEERCGGTKDVEGSGTHLIWEIFKGFTQVLNLELGDCICGLFWNETLDDYELRPMKVISKHYLGLKTAYEIITDKVFCFAHSTMFKVLKW